MPQVYHIKIKKQYAADLIDDLIKIDAVEDLEHQHTELPQGQKDALDKELKAIADNPDYTIHGGVYLRLNDAVIPTIKIDYHPFSFALSYDVNISKLKTSSYGRGGYELSLTYIGFLDRNNSSLNAVRCPRF